MTSKMVAEDVTWYESVLDSAEKSGLIDSEEWCMLMTRFLRSFAELIE